jgi:hypothetical protein
MNQSLREDIATWHSLSQIVFGRIWSVKAELWIREREGSDLKDICKRIGDETPETCELLDRFKVLSASITGRINARHPALGSTTKLIWEFSEGLDADWRGLGADESKLLGTRQRALRQLLDQVDLMLIAISDQDPSEALKEMALGGPAVVPEESPVICSQAALARLVGRSGHTTGLAEKLKDEEILRAYAKPSRKGGKYQFWFKDPEQHKKALESISQKPSRRPAKKRKTVDFCR